MVSGIGMKMEGRGVDVRRPLPRFACRGGNCPHGTCHPEHNERLSCSLYYNKLGKLYTKYISTPAKLDGGRGVPNGLGVVLSSIVLQTSFNID